MNDRKSELLALADALWLPDVDDDTPASLNDDTMRQASAALREYAALLGQEPVAVVRKHTGSLKDMAFIFWIGEQPPEGTKLYTHPPAPTTPEQIEVKP